MDFPSLKTLLLGMGGVGVVGGLIALAVMNPIAAAKLASQVSGFVLDKARRLVEWGRDPDRNWWKIGCLAFATLFSLAAFYAHDRYREVIIVREKCVQEKVELEQRHKPVREAAFHNFTELQACTADLARVIGEDEETERLNAEAVARAQARAIAAAKEAENWRKRYEARPASCSAALAALEVQCDSLADY